VELITIILSLEIHSFALFIIIPFRKHGAYRKQMEAGIKYALFGAAASGISLYGLSYIFGMTHTTYLADLVKIIPGVILNKPLMLIGLVMLLCGFFYKLALFPMHFWAPDVYEGAANETSGFVATLPKIGAVALLIRLISLAGADAGQFTWVLMSFAVLSMTFGNLSALVQNDIKRLLAYSSIAHAGYVMIGLLCATDFGYLSGIYYIAGYLLMNLGCFFVIYNLAPQGENITFDDLGGLYKRSPLLALTLAVGAFGLAGIPPTIGFTGKLFLFTAAIKKDMYALVILAVINTGIGIFYYLKMVRAAYTSVDSQVSPLNLRLSTAVLGIFFIVIILLLGTFPQGFMDIAKEAVAAVI
jgi:NADH-quinone oxidoreductase subunit N